MQLHAPIGMCQGVEVQFGNTAVRASVNLPRRYLEISHDRILDGFLFRCLALIRSQDWCAQEGFRTRPVPPSQNLQCQVGNMEPVFGEVPPTI